MYSCVDCFYFFTSKDREEGEELAREGWCYNARVIEAGGGGKGK